MILDGIIRPNSQEKRKPSAELNASVSFNGKRGWGVQTKRKGKNADEHRRRSKGRKHSSRHGKFPYLPGKSLAILAH